MYVYKYFCGLWNAYVCTSVLTYLQMLAKTFKLKTKI